jgi:uncharacterized protein YybS (DUF2232 family)
VALFFFLPIAVPGLLGWLNGLLAVPIFLLLQTAANERTAGRQIRNGLLMAGLASLLLGRFSMFLFTLTMLPLGYSLHLTTARQRDLAQAGVTGVIVLTISWFFFWTVYGIGSGTNPYIGLLSGMDAFMEQIVVVYRTSAEFPADALYNLEQLITGMREFLPKILPGLLVGTVLVTVILNMVIGRALLVKLAPEKSFWPPYSDWRLPDKAIWFLIVAFALFLVGKGRVQNAGLSLVFASGLLYLFQGVAVVTHVLNRWNLPRTFRLFFYVILALQRYGMLLVIIVGIADTWADFRKLDHKENKENKDKTE